jgi:hypothetical protein
MLKGRGAVRMLVFKNRKAIGTTALAAAEGITPLGLGPIARLAVSI